MMAMIHIAISISHRVKISRKIPFLV